ncbi:metal-binding protein [Clostridium rectalis]|uniref:metal-binding protein n=1 Tax=Clostridium rectalis TaxID=2040295 RepID=UPI000F63AC17|nr:metal-binding protein [Clostridium rectalis]
MTVKDIMKYIESEYNIITNTPCEMCGGNYLAENLQVNLINDMPFDVCSCICSHCGHEKAFEFYAPFIDEKNNKKFKKNLN